MDNLSAVQENVMLKDVVSGLSQPQKSLPSKYFYDERGSDLFNRITYLKEYYLTRSEKQILRVHSKDIAECIGDEVMLIELGSGSSDKTRFLLEQLPDLSTYIPVDISEEFLLKSVNQLRREYPKISIIPVFADYTDSFELPVSSGSSQKQVVFFPGSTVGNFNPNEARVFFENIDSITEEDSEMLIGVDLKKDKEVLEAAYNDAKGITAAFNKNILQHINRKLGADFEPERFKHKAWYNEAEGRIEMHLVATEKQQVSVGEHTFNFEEGETIHTENSYKYSLEEFKELVGTWYAVEKVWTDDQEFFSVQYLKKK